MLAPTANCTMFIARYHGTAAAGVWATRFAGTATFKLAGWDADSEAPPNASDAVQWAAIQWARSNGDRTYDFGGFDRHCAECLTAGRPLPDSFYHSPSFYKLGFGGTTLSLPRARFLLLPRLAHLAFGAVAQSLFSNPKVRRLAHHLRNGRLHGVHPRLGGEHL
jgi:hypothetical protein